MLAFGDCPVLPVALYLHEKHIHPPLQPRQLPFGRQFLSSHLGASSAPDHQPRSELFTPVQRAVLPSSEKSAMFEGAIVGYGGQK